MKYLFKNFFPAMLLVAAALLILALVSVSCGTTDALPAVEPVPDNPATALMRDMGIGINIGNTLDSIGTNTWLAGETGWGNPKITKEFIAALKKYGYTTIRLPVTWAENMGPGPNYAIAETWMKRVEEVVKWILDEDMYCILNLHHDGGESDKSWILKAGDDPIGVTKQFSAVWKQIAARFSGASDKLIFEAMNEVGFKMWNQWDSSTNGRKGEAYNILNGLNQAFVNTVRAAGGKNASRFLLVSGYYTDIDLTCDPLFRMPGDTPKDRLILSVHYYTPAVFCILEKDESWGKNQTDWGARADYVELSDQFAKIRKRFIDKGIPVILGEYGVTFSKTKIEAARSRWITAVTQICLNNGICPVFWDTGNDIKRGPESSYAMSGALKETWANIKR
ncbi:MAG: glycoside hydrolase family 5 protein [Spirochaetaceae bacterium]|jgi:endoglucanase|nr:glycoside hydrolase family 5 protein [Spirochaetaceae bacterium]